MTTSDFRRTLCPVCGGSNVRSIYSDVIPLYSHMLFVDPQDTRLSDVMSIEILNCDDCLHGFHATGRGEDIAKEFYTTGEYAVSYFGEVNSSRIAWVTDIVLDVCSSHELTDVLEVGCGTGEVLTRLSNHGLQCTGIDINPKVKELSIHNNLCFECVSLEEYCPVQPCDLLLARLFMEHMDDPEMTLQRLKHLSKADSFLVLEVPNATDTLKQGRFFEYYHEHRQYFSVNSMRRLLGLCGYEIIDLQMDQKETIMIVVAHRVTTTLNEQPPQKQLAKRINKESLLVDLVDGISQTDETLWWGAGFTGARILNSLPPEIWQKITLVDGDPMKQGAYVPGSRIQVTASGQIDPATFGFVFVASISSAAEIIGLLRTKGYCGPVTYLASRGDSLFVTESG